MKYVFFIIFFVSLMSLSCTKEQMNDCFTSTGKVVQEKRELDLFTDVIVRGNYNLILVEDSVDFIKIEAGSKLLEQIKTVVELRKLTIENTNTCNWVRSYKIPINLELHYTTLNQLDLWGTINLSNKDTLRADTISIQMQNNSGSIDLALSNNLLEIKQSKGASEIVVAGRTGLLVYKPGDRVGGNFLNLKARRVEAESRSEIDSYVYATESLKLITRAGGSLLYSGEAVDIEKASYGEGTVSRVY